MHTVYLYCKKHQHKRIKKKRIDEKLWYIRPSFQSDHIVDRAWSISCEISDVNVLTYLNLHITAAVMKTYIPEIFHYKSSCELQRLNNADRMIYHNTRTAILFVTFGAS